MAKKRIVVALGHNALGTNLPEQKKAVANLLRINKMLDFKAIAKESENKVHFVYNFLAVLEMLQQELVDIQIGLGYNNFWISPKAGAESYFEAES